MLLAKLMHLAHLWRQLAVVVAQFGGHVLRRAEPGVVIDSALQTLDMTNRAKGRTADFANTFGNRVGYRKDLPACSSGKR
jgi:hypothetical protein